jgi:hypothetical protein
MKEDQKLPPPTEGAAPPAPEPAAVSAKFGAEAAANAGHVVVSVQPDCADDASDARKVVSAAVSATVTNGPALQSLLCGRCFHGECIRRWIVHRGAGASCPLCKFEIGVRSPPPATPTPADQA